MHIFTDGSTASLAEKARRVLQNLGTPQSAYFFEDGYPRADKIANDTAAALEVFDQSLRVIGRCLGVLSTLEGEDTTEQEMLDDLKRDIKQAMGITPLVPGGLI